MTDEQITYTITMFDKHGSHGAVTGKVTSWMQAVDVIEQALQRAEDIDKVDLGSVTITLGRRWRP